MAVYVEKINRIEWQPLGDARTVIFENGWRLDTEPSSNVCQALGTHGFRDGDTVKIVCTVGGLIIHMEPVSGEPWTATYMENVPLRGYYTVRLFHLNPELDEHRYVAAAEEPESNQVCLYAANKGGFVDDERPLRTLRGTTSARHALQASGYEVH